MGTRRTPCARPELPECDADSGPPIFTECPLRARLEAMTNSAAPGAASAPFPADAADQTPQPDGYTLWVVLRRDPRNPVQLADHAAAVAELDAVVARAAEHGVTVRG